MSSRILLVEDDNTVGYMLSEYLKLKGMDVDWVMKPALALEVIRNSLPDLCILDVSLPEMDGFELAKKIRETDPQMPLIFLTARSLKVDVLRGFSMGADDYIVKPVDEEELVARVQAVLGRYSSGKEKHTEQIISVGNTSVDIGRHEIQVHGKRAHLTEREIQLLRIFMTKPDQLIPTDTILKEIWGRNDFFNRRSMDVFISRIRKKISNDESLRLENIHGKGFILRCK